MKINREFTSENQSPYETINFKKVSTEILNPDGSLVFKLEDFEVFCHFTKIVLKKSAWVF